MGPLWSPFWPPKSPQEHPKAIPKAAQDPPKWPHGDKIVASRGHFVSQSRPERSPRHPKEPIFRQNLKFSTRIINFQPKSKIFNNLSSIVDQPTYHISISIDLSVFQSPTTGAIKDINALPTRGHSLSLVCLCVCLISEHRSNIFRPSYTYPRTTYILQYGSAAVLRTSIRRPLALCQAGTAW